MTTPPPRIPSEVTEKIQLLVEAAREAAADPDGGSTYFEQAALVQAIADAIERAETRIADLSASLAAAEQEAERLRDLCLSVRSSLHACNRPILRDGLRLELRGRIDAALQGEPT